MSNTPAKVQPAEIIPTEKELIPLAPPDVKDREWFVRTVRDGLIRQMYRNPDLMQCSKESLYIAVCDAVRIGLDPTGQDDLAYIIPRKRKGVLEANFQPGYQGLTQLLYDNPHVNLVFSETVLVGEEFDYKPGQWPDHTMDLDKERTMENLRGAYAVVELNTSKHPITRWCNKAEIEKARRCSQWQGKDTPAWRDWPTSMARKVPILRIYKQCPRTARMSHALKIESVNHDAPEAAIEEPQGSRTALLAQHIGAAQEGAEGSELAQEERQDLEGRLILWQQEAKQDVERALKKLGAEQIDQIGDGDLNKLVSWLAEKHPDFAKKIGQQFQPANESEENDATAE